VQYENGQMLLRMKARRLPSPMNDAFAVRVVIPSWNGAELLPMALDSLEAQTYRRFIVTVVDNGSTDGTAALLQDRWPDVDLVELKQNVGFAPAVNIGVERSTEPLVALVNNDVELAPEWLAEMVAGMTEHPRAASLSCRLLQWHDRHLLENIGMICGPSGGASGIASNSLDGEAFDQAIQVFASCGGAAMYRRAAWERVGALSDWFFAYHEDLDWAFRARLQGYECWYIPGARAYHIGHATGIRLNNRGGYLDTRNSLAMVLRVFPRWALVRYWPYVAWRLVKRGREAMRDGWFGWYLRAQYDVIIHLGALLRERRQIQGVAVVTRAELEPLIEKQPGIRNGVRSHLRRLR
jgi:GT2 family glycosyltransferase